MARTALGLIVSLLLHGSLVCLLGALGVQPLPSGGQGSISVSLAEISNGPAFDEESGMETQQAPQIQEVLPQEPEISEPVAESMEQPIPPIPLESRSQPITQPTPAQPLQTVVPPATSAIENTGQGGSGESGEFGEPGDSGALGPGGALSFGGDYELGQANGPGMRNFVQPAYPPEARRQGLEGRVLLRVLVGADGKAQEVQVLEASHNLFIEPARLAILRSTFQPLLVDGQARAAWVRLPLNFRLQDTRR